MATPGVFGGVLFVLCVQLFVVFSDRTLVIIIKLQAAIAISCVIHDRDSFILLSYGTVYW